MGIRRPAHAALVVLALLSLALPLSAQTVTGTLQGSVTDRSGAVLPGVTVTIRNLDTGLERTVVTDHQGFYNATFLPTGRYRVTAELAGLGTQKRENVPVNLNQTTVQDFLIDPQMAESITVSAEAPRINVSDGEVKQTMRSEEIMALPQGNQTSFLGLAANFSGYQENMTSGQDNPTASSGSSVNFNGAGTRGTTFQINGVNNDDSSENQHRQGVALATIQSFQILSNSFSSEFGRGYGAVVLVQTKSGTNAVMGEVYAYAQDGELNAQPYFDRVNNRAKPDDYWREFGLTAGFPIIRDRLFGYVSGDEVENAGAVNATRDVFTAADRALPRLTLGNDTPANRAWQDAILARFPQVTPNDSRGPRAYTYPAGFDRPRDDYSARADWNMSGTNSVTARYQRSHQIFDNVELIVGEQTQQNNEQSNIGATWTNILTSNIVQEVRIGVGLRSTNVNIKAGNDTPIIRFGGTFGSIIGNAGNFPINRDQRDNQLVYNINVAGWATHTLKGGIDYRDSQLNDLADNFSRGFWTFGTSCAGVTYPSSYAAFMAGCVASYQKAFGPFDLENDISEFNAYVQDDWRPWDNLVLNLGVRYEYVNAPSEANDKVNYMMEDRSYIDPRFGFAYTPDWNRNAFLRAITGGQGLFSVRGGFGIFHGRVFQSIFSQGGANVRFNPPDAVSFALSGTFPAPFSNTNISDPMTGYTFTPGFPTVRYSPTFIDPDLQMPTTKQFNLTLERQVWGSSRLRVSYIGTIGDDLLQYRIENKPVQPGPDSPWKVAQDWACAGTGFVAGVATNATCPTPVPIAANEVSLRVPRTAERRPLGCCNNILVVDNLAESWYHAGQLEWETGFFHGFQGRLTYTYGKAIDTGSEATFVGTGDINIFPEDEDYKRGLSRFDTRHRFTMAGNYQLPFLRNRSDWIGSVFGGWTLGGSIRLSSGTPFTIVDGGASDIDFDGVGNARPVCIDPNYCGGWKVNHPSNSRREMPRNAFRRATPEDGLDDLMDRNTYFTDGSEYVDLSLDKAFKLPFGGDSIALRMQVFNVFDHVTWSWPVNDINNAQFGQIIATNYTPRTFQLGVRYLY